MTRQRGVSEALTQRAIMLAATEAGARAWRNNVGLLYSRDALLRVAAGGSVADEYPIHAGLVVGSSDLIGLVPVTVTPAHVGQVLAVFLSLEVKAGRRKPTPEQLAWLAMVRQMGGRAGVVRSEADAMAVIRGEG